MIRSPSWLFSPSLPTKIFCAFAILLCVLHMWLTSSVLIWSLWYIWWNLSVCKYLLHPSTSSLLVQLIFFHCVFRHSKSMFFLRVRHQNSHSFNIWQNYVYISEFLVQSCSFISLACVAVSLLNCCCFGIETTVSKYLSVFI